MRKECPSCGTRPGDGWCRACDAESDRLSRPETPEHRMAAIRAEIAETAGAIEATEERTPMPDVVDYAELLARIPEGYALGPWMADVDDHIVEPGGQDVALVGRFTDDPSADANAALIALAPELAAALRTLPAALLRYLYAEAGVRTRMLGATDAERLAHAAVRQDIRGLAKRFGVELGDA